MAGVPQSWLDQRLRAHDNTIAKSQLANGVRDENRLTDAVFYARHPEWKGKSLKSGSNALKQEWLQIREEVVRPLIKAPAQAPTKPVPTVTPPCLVGQGPLAPGQSYCAVQPRSSPSIGTKSGSPYAIDLQTPIQYKDPFPNIRKYRPSDYDNALTARLAVFNDPF